MDSSLREGNKMRIIDPHVHVWKNDPQFPWARERNHPREDATPEMLLDLMKENGVEKTVIVQVIHYMWDNSYAADAIKRYPNKFMGVCCINPEDPAAPDHLSEWTEGHGFHYEPEKYKRWTLKGMLDLKHDVLIAEELWDFIGGEGTYIELLNTCEEACIELRDEIDQYFKQFG